MLLQRFRPQARLALLATLCCTMLAVVACDPATPTPVTPPVIPPVTPAVTPSVKPEVTTDPVIPPSSAEVKISKENWPNGKLKYQYELRRNAAGKWSRTGKSSAYYDHGVLEREGNYNDGVRVGEWKYYDTEGKLLRTEQRGDGRQQSGAEP